LFGVLSVFGRRIKGMMPLVQCTFGRRIKGMMPLVQCTFADSHAGCSAHGRSGLQIPRGGNMNFWEEKKKLFRALNKF
jgi:hypothetical protein